ncbi:MAG: hybrid histidine kinase/response regulator HrmK [Chroococcidiopsidaceae cyanobacterium CP_BM_ER_R8_30]|nr:hybrid histidine kinase/response regulator HrmK [Chroococcidiopsidaceae cyanobacterium CP_BM_ER_R8_30]
MPEQESKSGQADRALEELKGSPELSPAGQIKAKPPQLPEGTSGRTGMPAGDPQATSLRMAESMQSTPTASTSLSQLKIQQLEAELWLEHRLNYISHHLSNCLTANAAQRSGAGFGNYIESIQELEAEIFQTLVMQISAALENIGVAIALPETSNSGVSPARKPGFKVCYVAPTATNSPEHPLLEIRYTGKKLPLRLKQAIAESELQQLQRQKPQSAWPLIDLQGDVMGWLVIAASKKLSPETQKAQLKTDDKGEGGGDGSPVPFKSRVDAIDPNVLPQLVERSLVITTAMLAQCKSLQAMCQQHQQLEIRNRELVRTNQLKSEFLANTSHEIRTPLSAILGFTHLLLAQGYNPDHLRHQEYLNIILASGQHLLALINDILDLSKIAANQLEIQWEPVDVPNLCQSVLTLVKEKASDKGLELRLEVDPQVTTLTADSLRLKQMLFNLLSNALKFTNQGVVGLRVKHQNVFLHFTVWDTGTGISQEQQSQLFQPYSQIANVAVGRQEGTGLGLALTQKLAELHGGWVEVQSELNRGSEFTIALPLTAVGQQASVAPSPVAKSTGVTNTGGAAAAVKPVEEQSTAKLVVMLVEDNLHNAKLMTTYLSKLGYEVTWAKNAAQMWEALKDRLPALILMDVHLPDVDGLTLLQQLQVHEQYRKIPVIAQTAMAMKGDRETCLAAGAIEYISKPIDLKVLATLVARYSNPMEES